MGVGAFLGVMALLDVAGFGVLDVGLLGLGGFLSMDLPEGTPSLTLEAIPAAGLPVFAPITVNVGPGQNTFDASASVPPFSQANPQISTLSLDLATPQQPKLTITGSNFGSAGDTDTILFQVGGLDTSHGTTTRSAAWTPVSRPPFSAIRSSR